MTRLATQDEVFDHNHDLRKHEPKLPATVNISHLKLADIVELFEGPFGTGTVRQIKDGVVTIARPSGVTGDFSHTGGVSFSVGVEECTYLIASTHAFKVWQRKDLR